jgi:hypothetical protein
MSTLRWRSAAAGARVNDGISESGLAVPEVRSRVEADGAHELDLLFSEWGLGCLESCSFVIGKLSRERITRGGDRSTRMCECGDALARPAQAKSVWNIELPGSSGSSARQAWLDRSPQCRRGRGTCSKCTTSHRCDRSQLSERWQRLGRRSALVVCDGLRARSPRRRCAWLQVFFWWLFTRQLPCGRPATRSFGVSTAPPQCLSGTPCAICAPFPHLLFHLCTHMHL